MSHKTYIRHVENGETAVLFIHGFLGSTEHFARFISLVPENYGIYNVLLEGHGGSTKDFAKASMEKWKAQVSHVVDELLGKYKFLIIVGHSMGTFFAMDTAVNFPDRIKHLFLLRKQDHLLLLLLLLQQLLQELLLLHHSQLK